MTTSDIPCPPETGICAHEKINNQNYTNFSLRPIIPMAEHGRKFTLRNNHRECIAEVKVDKGMVPQSAQEPRADYMLIRCLHNIVYIIELKGSDVAKACEQIFSTINKLSDLLRATQIEARIVCSRAPTPDLRSTHFIRLEKHCRHSGGKLRVETREYTETLSA